MKSWTREEDKFIVDSYSTMTIQEIAKALDRSYTSVRIRANKNHGLTKVERNVVQGEVWSKEEDTYLRQNYADATWEEMFQALPSRNRNSINSRARNLYGLSRSEEACSLSKRAKESISQPTPTSNKEKR